MIPCISVVIVAEILSCVIVVVVVVAFVTSNTIDCQHVSQNLKPTDASVQTLVRASAQIPVLRPQR